MSSNLAAAIFGGAFVLMCAAMGGYIAMKLKMSYDERLTPVGAKRALGQLTAFYVAVWLIAIAAIAIHDYA